MRKIDKDKFKEFLSIEQVKDLVAELGGEPVSIRDGIFISKTICHGGDSHKLYYYENSHMFKCYTHCNEAFDVFDLVCRCKNNRGEVRPTFDGTTARKWNLGDALQYTANYFNLSSEVTFEETVSNMSDWEYFNQIQEQLQKTSKEKIQLPTYSTNIIKNLPVMNLGSWEKEGIKENVLNSHKICFDPKNYGIVIPHFNENNELIGIRERILIEAEQTMGKYKPAILNGVMYNHPLGFNLYNLNNSKQNIRNYQTAIVFEGEKSCMKYSSYFGEENDISVAGCGSHVTNYQIDLLLDLGVKEIIIAFDKQYQKKGDKEFQNWTKTLLGIKNRYGSKVLISYILDDADLLGYKDSPVDRGQDVFMQLFTERKYV